MIEVTMLNFLKSKMAVDVYLETPSDPPSSYILIEKTGSGRSNHINNSTIAVQSFAASLYEAALLNENVKEALLGGGTSYDDGIVSESSVCSIELNSDYNATDTQKKQYRYQAVYDLIHY